MNAALIQPLDGLEELEFQKFIEEGLQAVRRSELLDFDSTFDELEERYKKANV